MTRRHWGCRIVQVDGQPVLVNATGPLTDEERGYVAELIAAAKARYAELHPDDQPAEDGD